MSRFLFFLLLVAVVALGGHLWLNAQAGGGDVTARELHPERIRVVAVNPPQPAGAPEAAGGPPQALAGAACVEMSGIAAADLPRARAAFAALGLGERVSERRVEEISRYWVFVPPARDRRAAEAAVAQLHRQGVNDVSIRPDNAISLGVFSSEEAAQRFLAATAAQGVRGAEIGPFAREVREATMIVREPDTRTVARLTLLQRDFPDARLRAVACPAPSPAAGAGPGPR